MKRPTVKQMFPQKVYTSPEEAVKKCLQVLMAAKPKQAKPRKQQHGRK
jgi:hypothetical protein